MAGRDKLYGRGSGPLWFLMLAITVFVLYSVAVAISTLEDCGDRGRTWQVFPPEWECRVTPGFG